MSDKAWSRKAKTAAVGVAAVAGAWLAAPAASASTSASAPTSAPASPSESAPASSEASHGHTRLDTTFDGAFTFHACPSDAAPGDFCLSDVLTGTLPGVGPATGRFEVDIHFGAFGSADCGPIEKHGTFTAADGSTIRVDAVGTYCSTPGVADYAYTVDGGTGEYSHAHGRGMWHVPAATAYVNGGGYGPEMLTGSLHLR